MYKVTIETSTHKHFIGHAHTVAEVKYLFCCVARMVSGKVWQESEWQPSHEELMSHHIVNPFTRVIEVGRTRDEDKIMFMYIDEIQDE